METAPFTRDEFAGWWRRLLAWAIDLVVYFLLLLVVLFGLALLNDGSLDLHDTSFFIVLGCISVLWDIVWIASPLRGKPGHRFTGVRIVRRDGSRVSVLRAIVRWAVRYASVPLLGLEALGSAVTIKATPRRQAVHDLVAGTVAVRAESLERIASPLAWVPGAAPARTNAVELDDDSAPRSGPFL